MFVESIELNNYRNFDSVKVEFSPGVNIFFGDNAQGKTNLLESIYVSGTSRSHRGSRDKELIRFGEDEAHIRLFFQKDSLSHRLDVHLKKNKNKGIAVDGVPVRRSGELLGMMHIVFFSPEDLSIIKEGPAGRRRFLDMELSQIDKGYLQQLIAYNKILKKSTELTISPKYQKLYTKNSKYPIDTIMIEDSTTGFSFFKKCVENCESFYGKDNYKRCFNIVKYGKLIIFDRMGFGTCIKDFYNLLLKHSELQILDYDSFEAFLLEIMDKNIDVEGYSEKELVAFVHNKLSQYGKSSTCSCFEKCKQCESCNFKNFFTDSRKVFKLSKYSDYVVLK